MLTTEFDIEIAKKIWREEAFEDGFEDGEAQGELKGELKGKLEGKLEMSKNLISLGIPREQVAQAAGLPLDVIDALLTEFKSKE
jgi:predicted transposase/invertase (TIGR01784 family)